MSWVSCLALAISGGIGMVAIYVGVMIAVYPPVRRESLGWVRESAGFALLGIGIATVPLFVVVHTSGIFSTLAVMLAPAVLAGVGQWLADLY